MMKSRKDGFTLIEMLVVLVIVGIMVILAIPAVTKLMNSGGVSSGSREVANTLGLARQLAVTRRIYARVVFPYNNVTLTRPDMWYLAYAVMTNHANTVAAAAGWTYASKWEFLPVGAVFLTAAKANPSLGGLDDPSSLAQQSLPFPNSGGSLVQLAYIEFGPTGVATPFPGGTSSTLAITEGFVSGSPPAPIPTTAKTSINTLANLATITADSLVGRIQVNRP
jgi:prepilin-type N-terminal cleavage/methylation domain-containing protein